MPRQKKIKEKRMFMKIKSFLLVFSLVFAVTTSFAENKEEVLTRNLNNLAEIMTNIAAQLESQDGGQVTLNDEITSITSEIAELTTNLAAQGVTVGNHTVAITENDVDLATQKAKINAIITAAGVSLETIAALDPIS